MKNVLSDAKRLFDEYSALRNREELMRACVPGGFADCDGETGRFTYLSFEAAAVFGATPGVLMEKTGGTVWNVFPPETRDETASRILGLCAENPGALCGSEAIAYSDKYGNKREAAARFGHTGGEGNRISFFFTEAAACKADLSEQLEREREMYRLAMEQSSNVMFEYNLSTDTASTYAPIKDADGKPMVARHVFTRYSKRIMEDKFVHPDDRAAFYHFLCGAQEKQIDARLSLLDFKSENCDYRWYTVTQRVAEYKDGRPYRSVGTLRDINDVKEYNRDSERRMEITRLSLRSISSSYLCVYYVDIDCDRRCAVRLPADIDGGGTVGCFKDAAADYIERFVDAEDKQAVRDVFDYDNMRKSLTKIGDMISVEYRQNKGGTQRWLKANVHAASMENGVLKCAVIAFSDVTEERRAALESLRRETEQRKAVEEAYLSAKAASCAKTVFLSKMSHNIRTPMNTLLGLISLAEQNICDIEKLSEILLKMRESGGYMLGMLNKILDISKIESGGDTLDRKPFNIHDMLKNAENALRHIINARGQRYELVTDKLLHPNVVGDEEKLLNIIVNLLDNAVKYTPDGGTVRVTADEPESDVEGMSCFRFIVEDNGVGFPPECREDLFTPFMQVEDSRIGPVRGTGLGLPIALNLAQMMNGTIEAESVLGKGSRFTVTVYLKTGDNTRSDKARANDISGAIPIGAIRRSKNPVPRVLLAEDNELNREITHELLVMNNLEVTDAVDGREAVDKFSASAPWYFDIILMDIQMPVMNGYDASRAIRAMDREDAATIPIIALTANAFADDIRESRSAGMNMHLPKPFDIERTMAAIREFLRE